MLQLLQNYFQKYFLGNIVRHFSAAIMTTSGFVGWEENPFRRTRGRVFFFLKSCLGFRRYGQYAMGPTKMVHVNGTGLSIKIQQLAKFIKNKFNSIFHEEHTMLDLYSLDSKMQVVLTFLDSYILSCIQTYVISKCIAKAMNLKKPKRPTFWNGDSTILLLYMLVKNMLSQE